MSRVARRSGTWRCVYATELCHKEYLRRCDGRQRMKSRRAANTARGQMEEIAHWPMGFVAGLPMAQIRHAT